MSAAERSRRQALALMLGAGPCLRAAAVAAVDAGPPIRMAISESMVVDVNLSDARAAMQTWIKRLQSDLQVDIRIDAKIFYTTEEILRLVRNGELDAAAINIVEYRPIAEFFDSKEIFVGSGESGPDEYVLLVKRDRPFRRVSDLRGSRLCVWKAPKMCAAPAWIATLLEGERVGAAEKYFGSVASETKISRVVLPVFFEQADACVASRRGFATMAELNPQVGQSLMPIATSATLVTCFYAFRKNYHGRSRDTFVDVHKTLLSSAAGRQLATLFQFDELLVRDTSCLASSLGILEKAERLRANTTAGSRRSQL